MLQPTLEGLPKEFTNVTAWDNVSGILGPPDLRKSKTESINIIVKFASLELRKDRLYFIYCKK
jgi:hypothetical protein